jgi:hypothetical protein
LIFDLANLARINASSCVSLNFGAAAVRLAAPTAAGR